MPSKRVIVHIDCVGCGVALPLGGLSNSVKCRACNWNGMLTADRWRWVLSGDDKTVSSLEQIIGETSSVGAACAACDKLISESDIKRGLESASGSIACSCGAQSSIRAVTESTIGLATHFSAVIGEGEARPLVADAPVNFPCSRCGAPLVVDGSTSVPTCQFCHTRTPLPESIWRQLHQVGRVHPFYLWSTSKAARAAAKANGSQKSGSTAIVAIAAILIVIGAAVVVGFVMSNNSSGPTLPHGIGAVGASCGDEKSSCSADGKTSLRCASDVWAVEMPCRGPKGCRIINNGDEISCDYTFAALGDPCDVSDSACAVDRKSQLKCDGNKFVPEDTCKGKDGCTVSPNSKGYTLTCDDHIADVGDACLESRPACSSDKKAMLVCKEGKFAVDQKCAGPGGCVVGGTGAQTTMDCDVGTKKKNGR